MTAPIRERIQAVLPGPWYSAGPEWRLDVFPTVSGQNNLYVADIHGLWVVGLRMSGETWLVSRGDLQTALEGAQVALRAVNRPMIDALKLEPRGTFAPLSPIVTGAFVFALFVSVLLLQYLIAASTGAAQ